MSATLSLDLFRPSILDPVDDGGGDRERDAGAPRARRLPADDPRTVGGASHVDAASHRGGGLTLDDLVVGVWEGLSAHRTVACPACGEAMTPRYGAGPAPVGGRCRSCGTTIQ